MPLGSWSETQRYGVYHLVNEGHANRMELAKAVLAGSGRADVPVSPIKMADWARAASSPPHSVLVNQAAAALDIRLPAWEDALAGYLALDAERFARG